MFFGRLELEADATLDPLFYYSQDTFYEYLELQGPQGRQSYLLLHLADYLFLASLSLLFAFTLYLLIHKAGLGQRFQYLALLPFVSGASDLLENLFIDISILAYPARITILASLAGYFTALKMTAIYVVFALILCLALLVLARSVHSRVFKA